MQVRKDFSSLVCSACDQVKDRVCTFELYRANLAKAIDYFIRAVDEKSSFYLNVINDPSDSGMFDKSISISAFYKYKGFDVTKTGPFCNHT